MKKMFGKVKRRSNPKQPLRHTHRTADGIEDGLAVLIDIGFELEAVLLRVKRAADILREVRAGPHAYDPDRPAGLRVTIKRK